VADLSRLLVGDLDCFSDISCVCCVRSFWLLAQRKCAKGKQTAGIKARLKLDADKDLQTCPTFSFDSVLLWRGPATKGLTCCTNINCATTCKLLFDCIKPTIPIPVPMSLLGHPSYEHHATPFSYQPAFYKTGTSLLFVILSLIETYFYFQVD